jgi:hypothetical protein
MGSDPSPDDVMAGISLGAVDFLAKPVSQLKLRNIWQHTVRKMMADMQICAEPKPQAAAKAQPPAAPAALDRSASNAPEAAVAAVAAAAARGAAAGAPSAPAAAGVPPKPPSGLPPRSPPLRAVRAAHRLHACVSSTNLAASGPSALSADDDMDFDFDAAAAAAAAPAAAPAPPRSPAAAEAVGKEAAAPSASGATATATATHVSVPPAPSCGVPVAGSLAPLAAGMVWGMPMPVVRAPGIVPPKHGHAAAPQQQQAAPWGFMGGCPMPPMGYMAPPYMMMPPPGMYGGGPACYGPPPGAYPCAAPPCGYAPPPPTPAPAGRGGAATGADAAKALDASLMSLLGSAEDDGDLEVDFDDVLQDLRGGAAAKPPAPAPAPASAPAGSPPAADSPTSLGSSRDALPRVESVGLLAGGGFGGDDEADADAFLGSCGAAAGGAGCGALGLDDWGEALALKKSASLADLLAGPLAVA